jgi:hypothetical protein
MCVLTHARPPAPLHHDLICRQEVFRKKAELASAGVLFQDDYDYTQHMRERAPDDTGDLYLADPKDLAKLLVDSGTYARTRTHTRAHNRLPVPLLSRHGQRPRPRPSLSTVQRAHARGVWCADGAGGDGGAAVPAVVPLVLPADMLGSAAEVEEDIGLLNRAAPVTVHPSPTHTLHNLLRLCTTAYVVACVHAEHPTDGLARHSSGGPALAGWVSPLFNLYRD